MKLFSLELKKMLWKRKGVLFILIAVIAKFLFLLPDSSMDKSFFGQEERYYQEYMQLLSGAVNEEKDRYLQEEQDRINLSIENMDIAFQKLREDSITDEEFYSINQTESKTAEKSNAFHLIYKQYLELKKQPENRYLMNTEGWESLLINESPDYILVLVVLLLMVPIFTFEYESQMYRLLFTSRYGRTKMATQKLLVGLFITQILTILFNLLDFIFVMNQYDLSGCIYPLQSIDYFKTSIHSVSVLAAYIGIFLLKMIGFGFFSVLIMVVSVLFKKALVTLFTSISALLLPLIIFQQGNTLFTLPFPIGFMLGTGYFRGTDELTENTEGLRQFPFIALSKAQIIIVFSITIILICILITFMLLCYTGWFHKIKRRRKKS